MENLSLRMPLMRLVEKESGALPCTYLHLAFDTFLIDFSFSQSLNVNYILSAQVCLALVEASNNATAFGGKHLFPH
jgi:hypothetical protein